MLLALGAGLGVAGEARAGDGVERCQRNVVCRVHSERGVEHSEQKSYSEALYEFQAAYAAEPAPALLLNIGRSLYRLDRPLEALEYFRRYRKEAGVLDPESEKLVRRYELEAGTAVISLSEQPEPRPAALSVRQDRLPPLATLGVLGGGLGLLIIGIGLGGGAARAGNELAQPANHFAVFYPSQQALETRGLRLQAAGISFDVLGLLAIGGGMASVGTWLYMVRNPPTYAKTRRLGPLLVGGPGPVGAGQLALGGS